MLSVKEIIELAKKGLTVELQQQLMDVQERELELREENLALKEKIKGLETELERKRDLSFEEGKYWLKQENRKEGPFCQLCYDSNRKLIRLQEMSLIVDSDEYKQEVQEYFQCFECKNSYSKAGLD
jgi:hypothetical protein